MITYFLGTSAQAVLQPTHYTSLMYAEADRASYDRGGAYLFVYRDLNLALVVDYDEIWHRLIRKSNYAVAKGRRWGPYSCTSIFERWIKFAIRNALNVP